MRRLLAVILAVTLLVSLWCTQALAGGFELGVGFTFPRSTTWEGKEGGLDVTIGYEFINLEKVNYGLQLQLISGWTEAYKINSYAAPEDMAFNSKALYLTARPTNKWLKWLQLKAGAVNAEYKTNTYENDGSGFAYGAGIVLGEDVFRLHLMDFQRYHIGDDTFDVFTITVLILIGLV